MAGLGIGGAMAILSRTLLYRAASVCAFVGALSFASYGVSLLVNADWENGSGAGNLLVGSFGFCLLFIAALLGTFGVIAWQTSKSS
jgi:hypothetical protein